MGAKSLLAIYRRVLKSVHMVHAGEQIEHMIRARRPLCDIQPRIDALPVDEEAKAALWLRAYVSRPSFQRRRAVEDTWRRHRLAGA